MYSGVLRVKRGETGKTRVDTPESGHAMCLIFVRVGLAIQIDFLKKSYLVSLSRDFATWILPVTG